MGNVHAGNFLCHPSFYLIALITLEHVVFSYETYHMLHRSIITQIYEAVQWKKAPYQELWLGKLTEEMECCPKTFTARNTCGYMPATSVS
jgi:hypothetical protein